MITSMDEFFELLELKARGMTELLVLSEFERPKSAYEALSSLREKGVPIGISTLYTMIKELEEKGLIEGDGKNRGRKYKITDEGVEVLEERKEELEKIKRGIKKFDIMKRIGAFEIFEMLRELFKRADELTPEERVEVAKVLMETMMKIKPILASKE